ncbi:hypothetical protein HHI36_015235 [Cryptolaemus montrouzieri]|uniref:Uncharacterized protein n=1 Tax=Cryptolaemus montrouzieri TaxID=559131 RepID=A0ABD2N5T7_9CUCU
MPCVFSFHLTKGGTSSLSQCVAGSTWCSPPADYAGYSQLTVPTPISLKQRVRVLCCSVFSLNKLNIFKINLTSSIMPENCKSCTLRDSNNNIYSTSLAGSLNDRGNSPGSKQKNIQVSAKILFGSVQAINKLKHQEKLARENKKI